jgi:hypothetical protein
MCKPPLVILRRIGLSVREWPLLLGARSRQVGSHRFTFMLSDNNDVDPAIERASSLGVIAGY